MNADSLLEHFSRISEAPEAIPRLRQFILDLAVRGKLVERDPQGESVSELFKQVEAKRARLDAKAAVKYVLLPPVRPEEMWCSIPTHWHWTRLGTIAAIVMGQSPPGSTYNKIGDGVPLINGPVEFTEGPFGKTVTNQYTTAPTNLCEEGDLLLCVRGSTTGRTNVASLRACIGRGVAAIRPFFSDGYIRLFIWRQRESIIGMGRGIAFPSVSRHQIEELAVPLPPLDEQRRIVAAVDQLMALCDRLGIAQTEREKRRNQLTLATLNRLNNGAKPDDLRQHSRFFIDHLPRLSTHPDQIKQIRQAILRIAVRGGLIRQSANDETASMLLKRISENSTTIPVSSLSDDEKPYAIPPTWQWVRFGQLITGADAGWSPQSESFPRSGNSWGVLKVSAVSWDQFLPEENKQLLHGTLPPMQAEVHAGDFLISRANTSELVARCVVVEQEPVKLILSDKIVRLQIASPCSKNFLSIVNNHAEHARAYYAEKASGTSFSMKNVSRAVIYELPIPLPPAAEQLRIVAKVEQLITLCDQLEAQMNGTRTESRRLLEVVLNEALKPATVVSAA